MCLKIYRLKTTQTNIETNSLLENVLEVRDYIRNNNAERGEDCSVGRGEGSNDNRVVRKLCHSLNRFFFLFFVEFAWNKKKDKHKTIKLGCHRVTTGSGTGLERDVVPSARGHRTSCWAPRVLVERRAHHIPGAGQCCWDKVRSPPSVSCSEWSKPRACWAALAPVWGWQSRVAPLASWPAHIQGSSPRSVGTVEWSGR